MTPRTRALIAVVVLIVIGGIILSTFFGREVVQPPEDTRSNR